MAKSLMRQTTHTEIDVDTGEVNRIVSDEFLGYVDKEPDFIKIYIGTQLSLNALDPSLAPYIVAFAPYITYANDKNYEHMVTTNEIVRSGVATALGVSIKRVDQIIKILVKSGIFIPIYREKNVNNVITRTKRRGVYFVNPWYVAKGSWKDIKALRQDIDYVKGTSSYIIDEGHGERRIEATLPVSLAHQITVEEYMTLKDSTIQ